MATQHARPARWSAQVPARNMPRLAAPEIRLSPDEILNNYLIENFEAYLWRDDSPGGTLWNLAQTDDDIAAVWNDVAERIPPDRMACYDTYYVALVAELSRAGATGDTKQKILAQVLEADDYVRRLPPPEGFTHGQAETPVVESPPPAQVADMTSPAVVNNFKIKNFEAYLWRKESPGGALRNLAEKDKVKSVWNDVWKRIPSSQRAVYDTYYRELVEALSNSPRWNRNKETKQQILAHVREANVYVEGLPLPGAYARGRSETPVVESASPPQVAAPKMTAVVPPVAVPVATPVATPVAAPVAAPVGAPVAAPVVQNEGKKPPSSKPKATAATRSKSEEKARSILQVKKFEEFLWGAGSVVGSLQSLALTDKKIKPAWDEAVKQIPPGLKERYATYHSMLVFELSRSAWWEFFTGAKKTKQQILAKVREANAFVEGISLPEASTHDRPDARD
jgi:hypothetical protein